MAKILFHQGTYKRSLTRSIEGQDIHQPCTHDIDSGSEQAYQLIPLAAVPNDIYCSYGSPRKLTKTFPHCTGAESPPAHVGLSGTPMAPAVSSD